MKNAKEEFLEQVEAKRVLCCEIGTNEHFDEETGEFVKDTIILKKGYSEEDLQEFLQKIDFSYDNGYGGQELFGVIWYKDNTWSERGEYDGAEWWEYKSCPKIPIYLQS